MNKFIPLLFILFISLVSSQVSIEVLRSEYYYADFIDLKCSNVFYVRVDPGIGSSVTNYTQKSTICYKDASGVQIDQLRFTVAANETKTISVGTTNGVSNITTIFQLDLKCQNQPVLPIVKSSSLVLITGGNLFRSNGFLFEYPQLPYPIGVNIITSEYIECGDTRIYQGVNLIEFSCRYKGGNLNLAANQFVTLEDPYGNILSNITFSNELQNYQVLSSSDISNVQAFPSNDTYDSFRNVKYVQLSTQGSNKKTLIKNAIVNSNSLDLQATFPISGSPSTGSTYLTNYYFQENLQYYYLSSAGVDKYSTFVSRYINFTAPFGVITENTAENSFVTFTTTCTKCYFRSIYLPYTSKISLPYPFGITNGVYGKSYTVGYSFPKVSNYNSFKPFIMSQAGDTSSKSFATKSTPDTTPPVLNNVELVALDGENAIIRINATDIGSGVNQIIINLKSQDLSAQVNLDASDLVSNQDGLYEKIFNYLGFNSIDSIYVVDNAFNYLISGFASTFNSDGTPLIPTLPLYTKPNSIQSGSDFKQVSFKLNNVNVNNGKVSNELYVKYDNMDTSSSIIFTPYFYPVGLNNPVFVGKYDKSKELFVVPFTIPARLYTGIIDYTIYIAPNNYTNAIFNLYLGSTSQLSVVSTNSDQLGPIITDITPSQAAITISDTTTVFFTFKIDDGLNKFKEGTVTVSSQNDAIGKTFQLIPTNDNIYNISFEIPSTCRSQNYSITSATLIDEAGFITTPYDVVTHKGIDPLMEYVSTPTISVTCLASDDSTLPSLQSIILDPSTPIDPTGSDSDRTIVIRFTTSDAGSGINRNYNPNVYISNVGLKAVSFQSQVESVAGTSVTYNSTIVIPYGYGYKTLIGVSIYGIIDNYLNIFGKSNAAVISTITSGFKYVPTLTGSTGVDDQGGVITLYGKRFGSSPSIEIDKQDQSGFVNQNITSFTLSTGVVLVFQVPAISDEYYIRVISNNQPSESLLITPGKTSNTGAITTGITSSNVDGGTTGGDNSGSNGGSGSNPSTTTDQTNIISSSIYLNPSIILTLLFIIINTIF